METRIVNADFALLHSQASSPNSPRRKHFVNHVLTSSFPTVLGNGSVMFAGNFNEEKASLLSIPFQKKLIFWFVVNRTKRVEMIITPAAEENKVEVTMNAFVAIEELEAKAVLAAYCSAIETSAKPKKVRKQSAEV